MPKNLEDDARGFYCGVLGFSEVEKPSELQGRGGLWLSAQSVRLHIGVEDSFIPAKKAHPAFQVSSLNHLVDHLETAGVEYQAGTDLPDFKRVYVHDPFGNRIELLEVITD